MLEKKTINLQLKDINFLNRINIPFVNQDFADKICKFEDLNLVKTAGKKDDDYDDAEKKGDEEDIDVTMVTLKYPDDFVLEKDMADHPDFLYVRALAIVADEPNDNGDYFGTKELKKSFHTFVGCPLFVNHKNDDVEEARGAIVYAEWDDKKNGIMIIGRVDAKAYPKLARGITEGYISGVSMGAVTEDTLIRMADMSEKPIKDIEIGDDVLTPYGNKKKVSDIHIGKFRDNIVNFSISSYHKNLSTTRDHPIYVIPCKDINDRKQISISEAKAYCHLRNIGEAEALVGQDSWRHYRYQPIFKEAMDVSDGDYFLIPTKYNMVENSKELDSSDNISYMSGCFLGDGYIVKGKCNNNIGVCFSTSLHETELHEKIKYSYKKYDGKAKINEKDVEKRDGKYINIYDSKLANLLKENFETECKEKRIKKVSFSMSEITNLISGYIDTDGCIAYSKKRRGVKGVQISSSNVNLLEDIQLLLILIDVPSTISSEKKCSSKNNIVKIHTEEHTLCIGLSFLNKFKNSSIRVSKMSDVLNAKMISAEKPFIFTNDDTKYLSCPVKTKSLNFYEKTFHDITVDDDHSYIANGVSVHNCQVLYSKCSICDNKAENEDNYCTHIKEQKTRLVNGKRVYEKNYGIKFIELSFVVDPACKNCYIEDIFDVDTIRQKVSDLSNKIERVASAKRSGKDEVDKLNQAEDLLKQVAKTMLDQSQYVQLEYVSDLVEALAKLQETKDELIDMGYEQVQANAPAGLPTGEENFKNIEENKGTFLEDPNNLNENAVVNPSSDVGSVTVPGSFATKIKRRIKNSSFKMTTPMAETIKNKLLKNWE